MKTFSNLFIVLLFAFGVKANAQITLLKTFPIGHVVEDFQSVYLKHSGFKFVYLYSDTLSFYNLNLSLYENVKVPGNWGANFNVMCISEGLFDTDTLHIDYLVQSAVNYGDSVVVYKDNGTVVYRNDSAFYLGGSYAGLQGAISSPIVSTDSGTFMSLEVKSSLATQLYKLPGSLPCLPGCYGDFTTSINPINNNGNSAMSIYPNPAVSYTNIYYILPPGTNEGEINLYDLAGRMLKKYTVTSQVDHLRLTTSDIAAGTYFYQLMVNGAGVATKKIIVVK
jgi:Secretion system C-terminal sorting domain